MLGDQPTTGGFSSGGLDCFGEPQVEGSSELTLKP